ncbi:hypothetical protein KFK09_000372 [Dendrobium nobile]|uniref:Uncharacterized protein n=1 Tax=Dendrobium nobile TaxID=94219 RepID=A0A8T3C8D3_DENNO|nr:hypothetical protein KFK09_000372 [Dendrobium nobile]
MFPWLCNNCRIITHINNLLIFPNLNGKLLLVSLPLPPHGQLLPVSLSLPPPEQPSAIPKYVPHHLDADFNIEDSPTSLQPFDSPLWTNYDYISWCDSLVDYETEL